MNAYIKNRMGDYVSPQVSQLTDVSGDYESKTPFLIKNISEDSLELEVKLINNADYITTIFEPGWNPELCIGVKVNESGLIQVGK